ncbi:MAG: NAD(P)/FAD-dependent oxidoreductase, partial [Clostridium sp.]|nr:NAD(P)/FAD-dependent oxidoreductase [Clostridium sp.]
GAGIAGMEAAKDLAVRGHRVSLYEASGQVGGAFIAASSMSFKEQDKKLITWFDNEVKKAGVEIHMNTPVTKELLAQLNPDEIIVATGAKARELSNIPGIEAAGIINAIDALTTRKNEIGAKVVIIGGGLTGIEMAYDMTLSGKKAEIVEMKDKVLDMPDLCAANGQMLTQIIKYYHIPIHTGANITKFEDKKVYFTVGGEEKWIEADTVVSSIGYNADKELYDEIKSSYGDKVHLIGDCEKVSNLLNATWSACELAAVL